MPSGEQIIVDEKGGVTSRAWENRAGKFVKSRSVMTGKDLSPTGRRILEGGTTALLFTE